MRHENGTCRSDADKKRCPSGIWPRLQHGVALVEFAFASGIFILLALAILDFSYVYWVNLTMQHAVREGARYAVTGQDDLDPDRSVGANPRCDAAREKIRRSTVGLFDSLPTQPTITFNTVSQAGVVTALPGNSCYGAGEIIMITVDARVPFMTPMIRAFVPGGEHVFRVGTTMKNEAFRP